MVLKSVYRNYHGPQRGAGSTLFGHEPPLGTSSQTLRRPFPDPFLVRPPLS